MSTTTPHDAECTDCAHDCAWMRTRPAPICAPYCDTCDDHAEAVYAIDDVDGPAMSASDITIPAMWGDVASMEAAQNAARARLAAIAGDGDVITGPEYDGGDGYVFTLWRADGSTVDAFATYSISNPKDERD